MYLCYSSVYIQGKKSILTFRFIEKSKISILTGRTEEVTGRNEREGRDIKG